MSELAQLADLSFHLALLSLTAIGGGVVMLAPEIERFVVASHGWISHDQFVASYAIAQAAPGPNLLFISLIGWLIAGFSGAFLATVAVLVPPALLTLALVSSGWLNTQGPWARAIKQAFLPLATGFLIATAWTFANPTNANPARLALTIGAAVIAYRSRLNPVYLIALGAVLGLTGVL
jgi:chromate transporter